VIPAAGLGTRCLPATKVVPKELLPIAGRPLIQYAVEEAVASGISIVVLVLGPGKELLSQYFLRNPILEESLRRSSREEDARDLEKLSAIADIRTVWQSSPLGLANAIDAAKPLIGDESFAVILPDALIHSVMPCIRQLATCQEAHGGSVVAVQKIEAIEVERFGIVETAPPPRTAEDSRVLRVTRLLERPHLSETTSRYGIFGRYILTSDIFDVIRETPAGRGGEFQLTDALARYVSSKPVYAYLFEGEHYDAGNKLGYIQATIKYALRDEDVSTDLRTFLRQIDTC